MLWTKISIISEKHLLYNVTKCYWSLFLGYLPGNYKEKCKIIFGATWWKFVLQTVESHTMFCFGYQRLETYNSMRYFVHVWSLIGGLAQIYMHGLMTKFKI